MFIKTKLNNNFKKIYKDDMVPGKTINSITNFKILFWNSSGQKHKIHNMQISSAASKSIDTTNNWHYILYYLYMPAFVWVIRIRTLVYLGQFLTTERYIVPSDIFSIDDSLNVNFTVQIWSAISINVCVLVIIVSLLVILNTNLYVHLPQPNPILWRRILSQRR